MIDMGAIHEIDCGWYLNRGGKQISESDLKVFGCELIKSFKENGVAYLKNTGISDTDQYARTLQAFKDFISLPLEEKMCSAPKSGHYRGYVGVEGERIEGMNMGGCTDETPYDIKEMVTFNPGDQVRYPKSEKFRDILESFWNVFAEFVVIVLQAMGMELENDLHHFDKVFTSLSKDNTEMNQSNLRLCGYPPTSQYNLKKGQMRVGRHIDFGVLSLIIQETAGLQVQTPNGEWIVPEVGPDTVMIIADDLLPAITNGAIKTGTPHKVPPPTGDGKDTWRYSSIFFLQADENAQLHIDGKDETAGEHIQDVVRELYGSAQ